MVIAALSSSEANVVGVSLGLMVGLVLVFWLLSLFAPAFRGVGMPGVASVSANLIGMLVTAAGSKWATEALLSDLDYSQILAPYLLTVAILFFGWGSVVLCFVVVRLAKNVTPGPANNVTPGP